MDTYSQKPTLSFCKTMIIFWVILPRFYARLWGWRLEPSGYGLPALKYLSRYLYRGVLSNKNIIKDDGTHVTFTYIDSKT